MSTQETEIYRRLQQRLDTLPIGYPATESGVEIRILKALFTHTEAEIAAKMSFVPESAETIYRRVKKKTESIDKLKDILNRMYLNGAINLKIIDEGNGEEKRYHLAFLAVGMYEYQVRTLSKDFYEDIELYFDEAYRDEVSSTKINQLRTIPIEESVIPEHNIATFDELREVIRKTNKIALMECICQKGKDLINNSCKQTEMREHCFALNDSARRVVERNNGKFITSDEALIILKKAQEEGLILQPGNALDPNFICCCCGCCCDLITNIKKLKRPWEMFQSNFYANVDSHLCIGCETCLNSCQMDAIKMVENIATVKRKLCIGCGNCVVTCPEEAITLDKKEIEEIPPNTTTDLYVKIMHKKAEIRRKEKRVL
ncbi:MAG: 4Fe-4S binding protein [Candidatus Lokiarchaeota archaeon]|nr:4Fe-4S binding protein [Candidatus Lokiarchaeota archaeon]